jgi:hypothetical protein
MPEPAPIAAPVASPLVHTQVWIRTNPGLASFPPQVEPTSSSTPTRMSSHKFLRENAKWILGAFVGGTAACGSLLLWLATYRRNHVNLGALAKNKKPDSV